MLADHWFGRRHLAAGQGKTSAPAGGNGGGGGGFYSSGNLGGSDLQTWIPLQTNLLGSGPLHFSDSQSPANVQRFYRAQLLP
jgi:hypothetical protein